MKVYFIGAGPGDPELITVKAKNTIALADVVICSGKTTHKQVLAGARGDAEKYDSFTKGRDEINLLYKNYKNKSGVIARLHSGDPSLYSALQEQMAFCMSEGIPFEIIPGISSFVAASAKLNLELTMPNVSQTVILSRMPGRRLMPEHEDLARLARARATMVLFMTAGSIEDATDKLLVEYPPDTPVAVVSKATWPDEKILRGRLDEISDKVRAAGIGSQSVIFVGNVLKKNSLPEQADNPT